MRQLRRPRARLGFTMVELLVAMVVAIILLALGLPELRRMILRSKLESFAREGTYICQRARIEAIKSGSVTCVQLLPADRRLMAYVDIPEFDANDVRTDTPFDFEPNGSLVPEIRDRIIAQFTLPEEINPAAPNSQNVTRGLTTITADPNPAICFSSDGSVADVGGYRFSDGLSNFVEVAVEPAATGKVSLQKWHCGSGLWQERHENWTWYYSPIPGC